MPQPVPPSRISDRRRQQVDTPSVLNRLPHMALLLAAATMACVTACTRVPEIEDQLSPDLRDQPYPALLPLDQALPRQTAPAESRMEVSDRLNGRAQALQARANRLKNRTP